LGWSIGSSRTGRRSPVRRVSRHTNRPSRRGATSLWWDLSARAGRSVDGRRVIRPPGRSPRSPSPGAGTGSRPRLASRCPGVGRAGIRRRRCCRSSRSMAGARARSVLRQPRRPGGCQNRSLVQLGHLPRPAQRCGRPGDCRLAERLASRETSRLVRTQPGEPPRRTEVPDLAHALRRSPRSLGSRRRSAEMTPTPSTPLLRPTSSPQTRQAPTIGRRRSSAPSGAPIGPRRGTLARLTGARSRQPDRAPSGAVCRTGEMDAHNGKGSLRGPVSRPGRRSGALWEG
jgi:hypothetical protein